MRDTPETALLALLTEECDAIRSGELQKLPDLGTRKATLVQACLDTTPTRVGLAQIARELRRNDRLIAAAVDGVKSAQSRLAALRAVRDGLSLYTAQGDRRTVAHRPAGLEHKA